MTKLTEPQNKPKDTLDKLDGERPTSLCLHYFSAHFEEQKLPVLVAGGGLAELRLGWAVGVLADGDCEPLGVWPRDGAGPGFWQGVWQDFDERGVGKLSWVSSADKENARALYPIAKVLPPFRRILGQQYVPVAYGVGVLRAEARRLVREASGVRAARFALELLLSGSGEGRDSVLSPDWPAVLEQFRPFYALRPHRRALVREGDRRLEQLGGMLARAVRRHGPFADMGAAVSFVAWTLARCQSRIEWAELPPLPFPTHPVGRAVARVAVRAAVRSELAACAAPASSV
ncbi:hypothetical protein [Roseateles sp.]|uniref:hypothetical protein n=1 Tax=Roseateles sp. TaxID=1971397 RepID=UPI003D0B7DE9